MVNARFVDELPLPSPGQCSVCALPLIKQYLRPYDCMPLNERERDVVLKAHNSYGRTMECTLCKRVCYRGVTMDERCRECGGACTRRKPLDVWCMDEIRCALQPVLGGFDAVKIWSCPVHGLGSPRISPVPTRMWFGGETMVPWQTRLCTELQKDADVHTVFVVTGSANGATAFCQFVEQWLPDTLWLRCDRVSTLKHVPPHVRVVLADPRHMKRRTTWTPKFAEFLAKMKLGRIDGRTRPVRHPMHIVLFMAGVPPMRVWGGLVVDVTHAPTLPNLVPLPN